MNKKEWKRAKGFRVTTKTGSYTDKDGNEKLKYGEIGVFSLCVNGSNELNLLNKFIVDNNIEMKLVGNINIIGETVFHGFEITNRNFTPQSQGELPEPNNTAAGFGSPQ